MRLSILVISRTPGFLSAMLGSLSTATRLSGREVEILCSWNGSQCDEATINNYSGYEILIAQRDRYHFATNMNSLAEKANGELLLLINDDVTLDPSSLDIAITCLESHIKTGLVGGRLRDGEGSLTHAGILFDSRYSPYHQLSHAISAEHSVVTEKSRVVPATTGALMLLRREHFQATRFSTHYHVCGEDVELCLDLRQHLDLEIRYCPGFSGRHDSEGTRSQIQEQQGNSEDLSKIRQRYRQFLREASRLQLQHELEASVVEAEALRSLERHRQQEGEQISNLLVLLKQHGSQNIPSPELQYWRQQSHALQLERLRLEHDLQHTRQLLQACQCSRGLNLDDSSIINRP